jgi:hypothetical protein
MGINMVLLVIIRYAFYYDKMHPMWFDGVLLRSLGFKFIPITLLVVLNFSNQLVPSCMQFIDQLYHMPSGASGVGESVPYVGELLAEENGRHGAGLGAREELQEVVN